MEKIYWFVSGDTPDKDFFKYGNRKPSDSWCMFDNLLSAYKHAYTMMLITEGCNYCIKNTGYDELDCQCADCGNKLPDNSSLRDYEVIFDKK